MSDVTLAFLDALRDPVDRNSALIEQAFVAAGGDLAEGLAGFDGLIREMTDLLAGLQGGGMTEASRALAALAARLVETGQALPRDVASLQDLATGNAVVARHIGTILEDVRMMFIIARSARIEAVVFGSGSGLDTFTDEIATLTRTVHEEVGRCAEAHAVLSGRIDRVAAAQADLSRDYSDKLVALAQDLSGMFAEIEIRQGGTTEAMRKLTERGARITALAGTALVALQSGDATRQRLEHVGRAIGMARDVFQGTRTVLGASRDKILSAIFHLQSLQIRDLSAIFDGEVAAIDGLLVRLGRDAVDLVESGGTLLHGCGGAERSFLTAFRARLAEAAALVGTCERARRGVQDAMVLFRSEISTLSTTVAALETVTADLVLIGINAGLRAARLGPRGRSLIVIADELKRFAGLITFEVAQLVTTFSRVEIASHRLDGSTVQAVLASSDDDLLAIASSLEEHDIRMMRCFAAMRDRALGFDADLTHARDRFRRATAGSADLASAADRMDAIATISGIDDGFEGAASCIGGWLWPLYTMARERDLHATLLGAPTGHSAQASVPSDTHGQGGDCDVFFEMAV